MLAPSNLQFETLSSGGSDIIELYLNVWICNTYSHFLLSLLAFLVIFPACLPWCFLLLHLLKIKPAWLKWMVFVAAGSDFRSLVRQQSEQCTGSPLSSLRNCCWWNLPCPGWRSFHGAGVISYLHDSLVAGCLLPPLALCLAKPNCLEMPNEGQARILCALINKKLTSGQWLFPALPVLLVCREAAVLFSVSFFQTGTSKRQGNDPLPRAFPEFF